MNNRGKGIDGEAEAVKYLKSIGYTIRDVNKVSNAGEVDIVAMDGRIVVFVEVKFRSTLIFGTPAEAIGYYKQRRYINSAKIYIVSNKLAGYDIRFDVIEILGDEINHIIDAFRAKS